MIVKERCCPICGSCFEVAIEKQYEDEVRIRKNYDEGMMDAYNEMAFVSYSGYDLNKFIRERREQIAERLERYA